MHTFTLPPGPEVGIVEMTGVQEAPFANQGYAKSGQDVSEVFPGGTPIRHFELRRGK